MLNFLKKLSIRKVLFFSFYSLTAVLLTCLSIYIMSSSAQTLKKEINRNILDRENAISKQLEQLIAQNVNTCFEMARDSDIQYWSRSFPNADILEQLDIEQSVVRLFENYWKIRPEILNMNLFLSGKKYTSSYNKSIYPLEEIQNTEWFKKIEGVSNVLIPDSTTSDFWERTSSTGNNTERITILSRVLDDDQKNLGYLCIDLSKEYIFSKIIEKGKSLPESQICIIDNHGKLIFQEESAPPDFMLQELQKIISGKNSGVRKISYNGEEYVLSYSTTNKQGWKLAELTPENRLYQSVRNLSVPTGITLGIALLLSLVLTLIFSYTTARPIRVLADSMNQFQESDKKIKIHNTYSNEIGMLNNNYNAMLDKIDLLIKETNASNEEKRKMEIDFLQAQINPHFLYNTLDSISWNAQIQKVPQISLMLSNLAKLYRLNLYKGRAVGPLRDELMHVRLYMDLQKQCFRNTFDYQIMADPELLDLYVPRFILQPIVENSIIHGFSTKRICGKITISATLSDNLYLTITDNGDGINPNILQKLNRYEYKTDKYGIYNICKRIALLCGKEYGIHYNENFQDGTQVILTLPFMEE